MDFLFFPGFCIVIFCVLVLAMRRNKKHMEAALKIAKENQEFHKESIALLKEISAKLNK